MKHIRIQISFVLLVFVIGLAFHQQVEAQDKIKSSVVGGGGVEPLTGTDYRIVAGTVGQPLVGQIGENKKEQVWNGFWYTQLAPPIADFTASKTEIKVGEEVTFTDKSRNRPTLWEWDLDGDGTVDEKYPTEKNPNKPNQLKFTYTASRVYSVTLKVTNLLGSSEKKIEIRVLGPPVAKFTANPISGTVPLIVTFKFVPNQPTNQPTSWKWDFGDGKTFDGENPPPHEYKDPGVYTVKLTVKNAIGEDSQTQVISTYIQAKQTFSLGQEISPPQGVDKSRLSPNPPKITITSNGKVIADPSDVENGYVFWHNETRTLYALKNGVTISTEWKDTQGSVLANVEATLLWPKEDSDYKIHVSEISVELNPNKKFGWIKLTDMEGSKPDLKQ
ncbi:PKD domain-containing protein, partial [Candidatus Poribacteria bacterium]|nr:PKD domain-containing protein [Candidatus Poribacteria bacterium]